MLRGDDQGIHGPHHPPGGGITQCQDFQEDRLTFECESSDGGEFSSQYSPANILRNDTSCYCSTRKCNVNVVLRFVPENPQLRNLSCTISHVIVKAPLTGFTSPVKDVLIFVFSEPPDVEASKRFDGMTQADYLNFVALRKAEGGLQPGDPAAFVHLGKGNYTVVEPLSPLRTGKYILVKFLTSDGFEENIDCQFVGFQGFVGRKAFPESSFR